MSRRKPPYARLKAIHQINELLAQAADLLPALNVDGYAEHIEFAEQAEFEADRERGRPPRRRDRHGPRVRCGPVARYERTGSTRSWQRQRQRAYHVR